MTDPLTLAALDTERHVARSGWDQPVRLFALVPTADLLAAEPQLGDGLAAHDVVEGALSAIEQEELPEAPGLEELLAQIAWPEQVAGCAIAVERIVVPPEAERDLPEDDADALKAVAEHPDRADVRLLVAVTRDGASRCLLRQRDHDSDDRVGPRRRHRAGPGPRAARDLRPGRRERASGRSAAGGQRVEVALPMAVSAARPSSKVATRTTRRPSGTWPTTSEQLSAGARKKSAPSVRAPTSFCRMPPIGPTEPVSSIVPVPATSLPPVSAPGVRTS